MLVKPGGWIQLSENDLTGGVSDGPALRDTVTAIRAWMEIARAGPGATFANYMTGWLKEEGFENTKEVHFDVDMGPSCKDAEWGAGRGAGSAQVMVNAATGIAGACKMTGANVPDSVLERLPERAAEELTQEGGSYRINVAIGQKPAVQQN